MVAQLLSGVLAGVVGLGSVALYLAAFFFPEVHRRHDFFWSGVGCFYALILWLDAGQITPTELLGHLASISLMGWLGWQTLTLRRHRTPLSLQTPYTADSWPTFRREMTALGLDTLRQTPLRRWLPDPNQQAEPAGIKGIRVSALKDVGYEFVDSVEPPEPATATRARSLSPGVRRNLAQGKPVPVDATPEDATPVDATPAEANPGDATPAESVQADPVQAEMSPAEVSPAEASPAEVSPAEAIPGDSSPEDLRPAESIIYESVVSESAVGESPQAAAVSGDFAEATPAPESPPKKTSRPAPREQRDQRARVSLSAVSPKSPQRQPSLKQSLGQASPTPSPAASRSGGKSPTVSQRGTMPLSQRIQGLTTWVQDLVRAKTAPKPKRAVIEIPPRPSSLAKRPNPARDSNSRSSPADSPPDSSAVALNPDDPIEPVIQKKPSQAPSPPKPDYPAPETSNWDEDDEDWI